jgi:sulfite exporter TauE/SafE
VNRNITMMQPVLIYDASLRYVYLCTFWRPALAPNNCIGVTKAQAACAADVLINYGLGFIPGYNGVKLAATLAGANFNFVQNLTAGESIVTFDNGGTIKDPLQGILWGANGLASTYSAISTAAANGLDASDVIVKAAGTAGTVANLLNTASAAYDLYKCKDAN